MRTSPTQPSSRPFSQVMEQHNLLGGIDVVTHVGKRARRPARVVHVRHKDRVGFVAALALVVEHGKRAGPNVPSVSQCPRCGHEGDTRQDFGIRRMEDGQVRAQSWCRACRGAHVPPRRAPAPESGWLFAG